MLIVKKGYIKVNSSKDLDAIEAIVDTLEGDIDGGDDFVVLSFIDMDIIDSLKSNGFISSEEYYKIENLDTLKFYID